MKINLLCIRVVFFTNFQILKSAAGYPLLNSQPEERKTSVSVWVSIQIQHSAFNIQRAFIFNSCGCIIFKVKKNIS